MDFAGLDKRFHGLAVLLWFFAVFVEKAFVAGGDANVASLLSQIFEYIIGEVVKSVVAFENLDVLGPAPYAFVFDEFDASVAERTDDVFGSLRPGPENPSLDLSKGVPANAGKTGKSFSVPAGKNAPSAYLFSSRHKKLLVMKIG
jgi:hypothetical protein